MKENDVVAFQHQLEHDHTPCSSAGGGSISGTSQSLNPKIGAELFIPDLHLHFLDRMEQVPHLRGRVVDGCITKSVLALHTCCVLRTLVTLAQILVISLPMVLCHFLPHEVGMDM